MPEPLRANSRPRKKATPFESNAVASQFNPSSVTPESSSGFAEEQSTWGGFEEVPMRLPIKRQGGSYWKGAIIVIVIAAIAGVAGYMSTKPNMGIAGGKKAETYNAVFLNNGQVYFGVIKDENSQHMILENVFYLQLVNETIPAAVEGGEPQVVQRPQLVKKGDEYYGPNTSIRISRSQIAVVEELREDSDVLRQIKERLAIEQQATTPPTP